MKQETSAYGRPGSESPDPKKPTKRPKSSRDRTISVPLTRSVPSEYTAQYRSVRTDDLKQRKPVIPIVQGLGVHMLTGASLAALGALMTSDSMWAIPAFVVSAVALAPGWRGLENLIHGAGHCDMGGKPGYGGVSRKANDAIGNALFAVPLMQDVKAFRDNHNSPHHGGFDGDRDPCRERMEAHPETRNGKLPSAGVTVARLPSEMSGFYRTVGSESGFALRALAWHMAVYILPFAAIFGLTTAFVAWIGLFSILFSLTLPLVRAVAESGEHDYRQSARGLSVAERTSSHHGFVNELCHLFGDAHHVEHHLYSDVPQYNLRKLRQRLIQAGLDPILRRRRSLLGKVEPYL